MDYPIELDAAHHIVGQIGQADLPCRARVADGPNVHGVHRVCHEPEDMFDPRAVTGSEPVSAFLALGKLMVPVAFLLDHVCHAARLDGLFLTHISGVCEQALSSIGFVQKRFKFLRVVD